MLALMSLVLAGAAQADTPLLHDGPPEDAVARIEALGGGAAWEFDPLRPEQLMQSVHAGLVGVDSSCQRAPTSSAELRKSVEFAETMFNRQNWEATLRHIADAKAKLPCLIDEADAVRIAHLHMMDGIVAHEQGRQEDMKMAFDLAQRFGMDGSTGQPMVWNDRLASPDRGAEALARAAWALQNAPSGILRFGPGVDPGRILVRVDGRAVPLGPSDSMALPVGYHHIQVVSSTSAGRQVRTFAVDLAQSQTLVVADPGGLTGLSLSPHVNTPALGDLIRAAGIRGTTWVVAGDEAWSFDTEWTAQPTINLNAQRDASLRSSRLQSAGITSIICGAVVSSVALWGISNVRSAPGWESTPQSVAWRQQQYWAWMGTEALGLGSIATGSYLLWKGRADR